MGDKENGATGTFSARKREPVAFRTPLKDSTAHWRNHLSASFTPLKAGSTLVACTPGLKETSLYTPKKFSSPLFTPSKITVEACTPSREKDAEYKKTLAVIVSPEKRSSALLGEVQLSSLEEELDAVYRALNEKEQDLYLAAEIGQTLLEQKQRLEVESNRKIGDLEAEVRKLELMAASRARIDPALVLSFERQLEDSLVQNNELCSSIDGLKRELLGVRRELRKQTRELEATREKADHFRDAFEREEKASRALRKDTSAARREMETLAVALQPMHIGVDEEVAQQIAWHEDQQQKMQQEIRSLREQLDGMADCASELRTLQDANRELQSMTSQWQDTCHATRAALASLQEQVDEQRKDDAVANAEASMYVDEVRRAMRANEDEMVGLREEIEKHKGTIADQEKFLGETIAYYESANAALLASNEDHATRTAVMEQTVEEINAARAELEATLAEERAQAERDTAAANVVSGNLTAAEQQLDECRSCIQRLEAELSDTSATARVKAAGLAGALAEAQATGMRDARDAADQLKAHQATIAEREATIATHIDTIALREATIIEQKSTIAARDASIGELTGHVASLEGKISELEGTLAEASRDLAEQRVSFADLQNTLAEVRAAGEERATELSASVAELEHVRAGLIAELEHAKEQCTSLTAARDALEASLADTRTAKADLEADVSTLRAQVVDLERDLAQSRQQHGDTCAELARSKDEVARQSALLAEREGAIAGLSGDLHKAEGAWAECRAVLADAEQTLAAAREEDAAHVAALAAAETREADLKAALASALAAHETASASAVAELAAVREEHRRSEEQLAALRVELATAEAASAGQRSASGAELEALHGKLAQCETDLAERTAALREETERSAAMRSRHVAEVERAAEESARERAEQEGAMERLKADLAQLTTDLASSKDAHTEVSGAVVAAKEDGERWRVRALEGDDARLAAEAQMSIAKNRYEATINELRHELYLLKHAVRDEQQKILSLEEIQQQHDEAVASHKAAEVEFRSKEAIVKEKRAAAQQLEAKYKERQKPDTKEKILCDLREKQRELKLAGEAATKAEVALNGARELCDRLAAQRAQAESRARAAKTEAAVKAGDTV